MSKISPIEAYQNMKAQMEATKREMRDIAKKAVESGAESLFEKHPELVSFSWNQYTPYFMDGDECIFTVNSDYPDFVLLVDGKEVPFGDGDIPELNPGKYVNNTYVRTRLTNPPVESLVNESVQEFLRIFDDETLKNVCGDHITVTVHRTNGYSTDHCDHE